MDEEQRAERTAEFETWFSEYPHRVYKRDAWKAYWAARDSGVSAETLLRGARGYARLCRREETETKYIQSPSRWLEAGRWTDDYPPAVQRRPWYHVAGNE